MRALARAQPNIALVKYWGKRDLERNLPATGSLSVTLDSLWTETSVELGAGSSGGAGSYFRTCCARADHEPVPAHATSTKVRPGTTGRPGTRTPVRPLDSLRINGEERPDLLPRVSRCLDAVIGRDRPQARVESRSNFPLAAGLASSASGFAALVVAADAAAGRSRDALALARLAGAASGSAARSLFEGIVALDCGGDDIDVQSIAAASDWPLAIVVAITGGAPKSLSSSEAMIRCAATSPFYACWVERQQGDLQAARRAVAEHDFAALAAVAEHNCLKMHSVMWTARPAIVYWNHATVACMEAVRELQRAGVPVFFTIDAGAQVKAVCLPGAADAVHDALENTPGVTRVMTSGLGAGARVVERA
ncbi:MAG TPA: diphosphomevalonate decarboxylase [Woeseiaceae bacterium]|nr:diphosphomevalonate decarboxylase [Woeseiaceae bacterium]